MLLLDTLEQHHYAIHDGVRQVRVRGFGVATPAADLREHELHKDRQGTLGDRVRYQTPLVVVEVAVRGFHPHSRVNIKRSFSGEYFVTILLYFLFFFY